MIGRTVCAMFVLTLISATAATIPSAMADVEIRKDGTLPHTDFIVGTKAGTLSCNIILTGEITVTDAAALNASTCPDTITSIFIDKSSGGDVGAAMDIGRWAREQKAWVGVVKYCYSSCALVFIGGVKRANLNEVGLHRPYLAGAPRSDAEVEESVQVMFDQIREYVDEMGVSPEFANVMLNTPPSTMRIYRKKEIYELVTETDPIYDEWKVARQARKYGITTDEFRRRDAEAQQTCVPSRLGFSRAPVSGSEESSAYDDAVYECEEAIHWGLSRSVYLRRKESIHGYCGHYRSDEDLSHDQRVTKYRECRINVMRNVFDVSGLNPLVE